MRFWYTHTTNIINMYIDLQYVKKGYSLPRTNFRNKKAYQQGICWPWSVYWNAIQVMNICQLIRKVMLKSLNKKQLAGLLQYCIWSISCQAVIIIIFQVIIDLNIGRDCLPKSALYLWNIPFVGEVKEWKIIYRGQEWKKAIKKNQSNKHMLIVIKKVFKPKRGDI